MDDGNFRKDQIYKFQNILFQYNARNSLKNMVSTSYRRIEFLQNRRPVKKEQKKGRKISELRQIKKKHARRIQA